MGIIEYGDYIARLEYDTEIGKFFGEVVNTADVITFYGASVEELEREFATSIEAHLAFCRKKGVEPGRPFPG